MNWVGHYAESRFLGDGVNRLEATIGALRNGICQRPFDLGFVADLVATRVDQGRLVVLVPTELPLATKSAMTVADLSSMTVVELAQPITFDIVSLTADRLIRRQAAGDLAKAMRDLLDQAGTSCQERLAAIQRAQKVVCCGVFQTHQYASDFERECGSYPWH